MNCHNTLNLFSFNRRSICGSCLLLSLLLVVSSFFLPPDCYGEAFVNWSYGDKGIILDDATPLYSIDDENNMIVLQTYNKNTTVEILQIVEPWFEVKVSEQIGWIHMDGIRPFRYYDEQETATVNNPNPADRLHLRKKASTSSDTMGKYYNGTKVVLLDQKNTKSSWTHVRIGDLEGYMMTKYLVFGEESEQIISYQPEVNIDNRSGEGLNFRIAPKGNADIIQLLKNGTKVTVLGISDQWLHIMIGDKTGFIRSFGTNPKLVYQEEKEETEAYRKARVTCNCSVYLRPFDESDLELNPNISDELNRGTLSEDDVVSVYRVDGDWALVSYGSHKYYISTNALALEDANAYTSATVKNNCSVYLQPFEVSELNPNIADELNRGTLTTGDVVTVYEVSNGWALVSYGSHKYYVKTTSLDFN